MPEQRSRARGTSPDAPSSARLVEALGRWYDRGARDLPWRRTRDPYAIWVSEIMLQQTRVDTVIPYYERFLARYPDVGSLARAEVDEVLSLWSGLGYYRRARTMQLAAKEVAGRRAGAFPDDAAGLAELPGIGAYTAGAIASIAFNRRAALVDGNVARVLARIYAVEDDVASGPGRRAIWSIAERLVPADRPGRFNQALMELGAMVCTPRDPRCGACPVSAMCVARAAGRQGELPIAVKARARPRVAMVAAVVRSGPRVLLGRRDEASRFGGLWEPPMVEAADVGEARRGLEGAGVDAGVTLQAVGEVRHILTHRELAVTVTRGEARSAFGLKAPTTPPYVRLAWLDPNAADVGISTLARKVLKKAAT